ncbi:MAG: flavin reductase family protein [Candidatus Eisenbacteria bacterium]|nr:flavin reductase family protein [Candidatus Latescibacterota bacterium]MBD3302050.1 flavin reductase family protein [Candidatus Eisenbacteria bacterium]
MQRIVRVRPDDLDRRGRYALVTGIVVPRPIAWVSSIDSAGVRNLAPFSFFGGISSSPPLIGISIGRRRGRKKDTLRNLEEVGEAVVHVPTEELAEAMVHSSADFPPEVDELEAAGLTPLPAAEVRPPRIAEAPVAMECAVERILELGDPAEPNGFVVARILLVHLREDLWEEGKIRGDRLRAVGRLGGISYCTVRELFEIPRPGPDATGRPSGGRAV